jgi:hypothetical protein
MTIECIPLKYNTQLDKDEIRLVKAAVLDSDGKVYTGWRHWEILHHMKAIGCARRNTTDDQGFVDQHGNYFRRKVCSSITFANGQLKEFKDPVLSEYLWDEEGNPI